MKRQSSFRNEQPTLFLVATPIGNLSDMTYRAVETLQQVDVIYCEDTRVSGKLLKHFEITTPMHTYHDHNKDMQADNILLQLSEQKNVALISDAGMPLISDPGYVVVNRAIDRDFNVVSIPGPSAVLTALSISGLPPHPFLFYGFLDAKASKRKQQLESLKDLPHTLVFYESPHRILKTIEAMYDILGVRELALCRELTKQYEEIIRGTTESLREVDQIKGEMVLVVGGYTETEEPITTTILEDVEALIEEGLSPKQAIKQVAKQRNLPKNDVYMTYHQRS